MTVIFNLGIGNFQEVKLLGIYKYFVLVIIVCAFVRLKYIIADRTANHFTRMHTIIQTVCRGKPFLSQTQNGIQFVSV